MPNDKKPTTTPLNPAKPARGVKFQSPPGAPQKPSSSPPQPAALPSRQLQSQASLSRPARPGTPPSEASQGKTAPSTPNSRSPGSGTPKVSPAPRVGPSPSPGNSPSQQTQRSAPKTLLPAPQMIGTATKSNAQTLLEAFSAPLPELKLATDKKKDAGKHKSSTLVEVTEPPQYWTELAASHYLAIPDSYLSNDKVRQYLNKHCAPSPEPTFRVRREADLIPYAALHLTHAPNMALGGTIFPGKVEMVSEFEKDQTRSYAALEMKTTGTLKPGDFLEAKLTEAEAAEHRKPGGKLVNPEYSFFKRTDIAMPVKQMTTYAHNESYDTRYVGLFDGEYLFLGFFSPGPKGPKVPLLTGTKRSRKAKTTVSRMQMKELPVRGLAHRAGKEENEE
ncbi:hypothetical protein VTI74DRAFT_10620 [Chaetomium olivicolor]